MTHRLARLYTPLEEAVSELHARRHALASQPRGAFEQKLLSRPHAVLGRFVATPNFESERFASLATAAGLSPIILEFYCDKFVSVNPIKYALARMGFYAGIGRNGGSRVRYISVAHLPTADGMVLQDTTTLWGQRLISFHHELLSMRPSLSSVETYDASDWFLAHGPGAQQYYADFFTLFIDHAILFENFMLTREEEQFTSEIIIPAFETAFSRRGLRPLICRLDPPDAEGNAYWLQYPQELQAYVTSRLSRKQGTAHDGTTPSKN